MICKLTPEKKELNKSSRLLLSYLQNASGEQGFVEISLLELSAALGLCRNTITNATALLEDLGVVTVSRGRRNKTKSGKESAGKNIYRLIQSATNNKDYAIVMPRKEVV